MAQGICCAGNMIVDITYPIATWPKQSELTHITDGIVQSTGGSVCNTLLDLAKLDPSLQLTAMGVIGRDPEGDMILDAFKKHPCIRRDLIRRTGRTSFTAVMSNNQTKERTFFHYMGANGEFCIDDIDIDQMDAAIFHMGYILLLPQFDKRDTQYGTMMARLLHTLQQRGIRTSVDVVSESGNRFRDVVIPALKYADYCIINEVEAAQITGIALRDARGILLVQNMRAALSKLHEIGVAQWAIIHCPELGCGMTSNGIYREMPSLRLPKGYIQGTVGAGDAFCAGILYAAEKGQSLDQALQIATCVAAASLGAVGASEGVQTAASVLKLQQAFSHREEIER